MQSENNAFGSSTFRVASFLFLCQLIYYSEARGWLSKLMEEVLEEAESEPCIPTVYEVYTAHLLLLTNGVSCHALHPVCSGRAVLAFFM